MKPGTCGSFEKRLEQLNKRENWYAWREELAKKVAALLAESEATVDEMNLVFEMVPNLLTVTLKPTNPHDDQVHSET